MINPCVLRIRFLAPCVRILRNMLWALLSYTHASSPWVALTTWIQSIIHLHRRFLSWHMNQPLPVSHQGQNAVWLPSSEAPKILWLADSFTTVPAVAPQKANVAVPICKPLNVIQVVDGHFEGAQKKEVLTWAFSWPHCGLVWLPYLSTRYVEWWTAQSHTALNTVPTWNLLQLPWWHMGWICNAKPCISWILDIYRLWLWISNP